MTPKTFAESAEDVRRELRIVFEAVAQNLRLPGLLTWVERKITKREDAN